jgi:restriction system protein
MQIAVIVGIIAILAIYIGLYVLAEIWKWLEETVSNIQKHFEDKRQLKIENLRKLEIEQERAKLLQAKADEASAIAQQRQNSSVRVSGQPDFNSISNQVDHLESVTRLYERLNAEIQLTQDSRGYSASYLPAIRSRGASQEDLRILSGKSDKATSSDPMEQVTFKLSDLEIPTGATIKKVFSWRLEPIGYPRTPPSLNVQLPTIPPIPEKPMFNCNDMRLIIEKNGERIEPVSDFLKKAYNDEILQFNSSKLYCQNLKQQADDQFAACEIARDLAHIRMTNQKMEAERRLESLLNDYKTNKNRLETDWRNDVRGFLEAISGNEPHLIAARFNQALCLQPLPIPSEFRWETFYDAESRTLQVNQNVPSLDKIIVKRDDSNRALSKRDTEEFKRKIMPLIALHTAQQIARNDEWDVVDDVVVNLLTSFNNKSTGNSETACILTFRVKKETILSMQINNTDPPVALRGLGGVFVYDPKEVVPVDPIFDLNRDDDRFVKGKDVLSDLVQGQNLAAMDWQDFEHLIRELFAKEFSRDGAEVKITRASRDRGVDAVAFDPDPIRGGKFVIQAKRYTGTVDVSAVRDLYGTLVNEGASKGILVTTSRFGPDAREFIANKPITLIDGGGLLSMLARHGYRFRIDLEEARKLYS